MFSTCRETLEALEKSFQKDGAGDWQATIQFSFSGEKGGDFYLEIREGTCTLHEGRAEAPTAEVSSQDQTWIDLSQGKINPMTAFMTGKVKVKGHMGDLMKLQDRRIFRIPRP